MKALTALISLLLISMLTCSLTAEAKSKTFKACCIVPANLELSGAISDSLISDSLTGDEQDIITQTPSTIQTRETTTRENQKTIIYTITER